MYFLKFMCFLVLDETYKFWSSVLALLTVALWLTAFGGVGHLESPNLYDFFSGSWTSKWMECGGFQVLSVWGADALATQVPAIMHMINLEQTIIITFRNYFCVVEVHFLKFKVLIVFFYTIMYLKWNLRFSCCIMEYFIDCDVAHALRNLVLEILWLLFWDILLFWSKIQDYLQSLKLLFSITSIIHWTYFDHNF